jgi:hypothetical protein
LGITQKYEKKGNISAPPQLPYPANPKISEKHFTCHHSCSKRRPQDKQKTLIWNTLEEFIANNMQAWEQHLLSDIEEMKEGMTLADALRLGLDIWLITDGGDTDGNGYYGWVIATDTHILFKGKGLSPGNQELNESLRSESTAYLSVLRFLVHYRQYHQLTLELSNKFHYCDNKSLVGRSKDAYASAPPSSFSYLKPDYDVQMEIINTIHELDIDLETTWVKGHQDDHLENTQLDYESRLNIQADILATSAWQQYACHKKHVHYPSSQCTLYINGEAVNRAYRSYMRRAYASHDAREYLMTKYKWDFETCEGIDWYSHGTAIKSLPYNQLIFE